MITNEDILKLRGKKLIIIGDLMIDEYIIGDINRISPEAPVPVLLEKERKYRLGGAANVAMNIAAMESTPIVIGMIGKDLYGDKVKALFEKHSIQHHLYIDDKRPTTVKTRFISQQQQLLRSDIESSHDIEDNASVQLLQKTKEAIQEHNPDGVILQDYNKGFFTENNIGQFIQLFKDNNIPIFVDPKKKNFFLYKDVTVFKPNKKELYDAALSSVELMDRIKELKEAIHADSIICTLGSDGVILYDGDVHHEPTDVIGIADVSGAGDSSLSAIALSYLAGFGMEKIGQLSNLAGGLACKKSEVSAISIQEMLKNNSY